MDFLVKKKQTPSVPILPLIDILMVMLIFFVVTTEFKKKRHTLVIDLPSVSSLPTTVEVRDTNVIGITKDGQFAVNSVKVNRNEVLIYLQVLFEENPDGRFEIEQDKGTAESDELFALEALKKIGFKYISKRVLIEGEEE